MLAVFAATIMTETACRSVTSAGVQCLATAKRMILQAPPLTIREAADFIGVSVEVMRAIVRRKEVNGFKLAGQWRIQRHALNEYLIAQITGSRGRKHNE